ncbi:MAG: nicotinate-nucleotide adenylyltransferase [Candidatus Omnitrophica bacterium]|nr:nicotinate-nucleotide adenylyltransferase [Candidatus Omnitrophota bacterium]
MEMARLESKGGIGVFGGTFNPIHLGHLIIAEKAREALNLKRIVFIPSRYPPHKGTPEIGAIHRYRMVKLAISTNPYFITSQIELRRKGISYTIDTVRALKKLYSKEKDFYLILGLDSYLEIGAWKDIEKLARLIRFIVVKRPGYQIPPHTNYTSNKVSSLPVKFLNLGPIGISSTEVRNRIKDGGSVRYLLPKNVMDYIFQRHLYE